MCSVCQETSDVLEKEVRESAIVVQHDWFHCVSSHPFKFFVGLREPECKTEFFDCIIHNGNVEISMNNKNIEVKIDDNTMRVTVPSIASTLFVAPAVEYGGIHNTSITTIDVSQSGNMFLTTDSFGKLKISSTVGGRVLRILEGHSLSLYSTCFFPSGLVVLSGGMDFSLRVWSVETATAARVLKGHSMAITGCAVIDVGRDVVSCSKDGTIKKWNCGRGECDITWTPEAGECNTMNIDRDNSKIAVGCSLNKVYVYPIDSKEQVCCLITSASASSLSFSPTSQSLVVGDDDGRISVYDIIKGSRSASLLTSRGRIEKIDWRLEGIYAAFHDGTMCCYHPELTTPSPKTEYSGGDCDPIYSFAIHEYNLFTACRDKNIRKYKIVND